MVYLDNAATTRNKPECVYDAFNQYVREIAVSPGRGSYSLGIEASRMLYQSRKTIGSFFGLAKNTNVVFTKNSTEAINLFFRGYLTKGDHVVITTYEHNAVLRPVCEMQEEGIITYSVIEREDLERDPGYIYEKYFTEATSVFATTLASNLTGRIIINKELLQFLHDKKITTFVDASQGAGKLRLDMQSDNIDYLAFTGHKDLMGLPGVGGLCCTNGKRIKPLIQGGTGLHGDSYTNPDVFPEGLEAGTLNMPAIWSLKVAIDYLNKNWNEIQDKEIKLKKYLIERLSELDRITILDRNKERVSTVGILLDEITSDKVVEYLDKNEICVRGGIHCAILAHEALNTVKTGVVRISLGFFNTERDIDFLIDALKKIRG